MSNIDEQADSLESSSKESAPDGDSKELSSVNDKKSQIYWSRLKKITAIWMIAWTFPAVLLHIPVSTTSSIKILGGIPLHWFNAALVSILIGVVLIFLYAFVMDKTDRILKEG